jgi:hypothetical protein
MVKSYRQFVSELIGRKAEYFSPARYFHEVMEEQIFAVVETNKLDAIPDVANAYWIQAWRWGEWDHPKYDKVKIDSNFADTLISNFKANVYGQDLPFDFEHGQDASKGLQAAGWIRDMAKRDDGVYYMLEFTADAVAEIKAGKWRYVSPSYVSNWKNAETNEEFTNVPTGGGITNRPYFKGMLPLNFSELYATKDELEEWKKEMKAFTEIHIHNANPRKEDSVDDNELVRKFAEKLGITLPPVGDAFTEDAVLAKATELADIVEPLRKAQKDAVATKTFREQYPDEYKQMEELRAGKRDSDARDFASAYERFTVKEEGKEDRKDMRGFSALVLTEVAEVHKKFSEGTVASSDLQGLLDKITTGGIVEYGERGSSRKADESFITDLKDTRAVRKDFSELVKEVMTEDGMTYEKALSIAAKKEPDLFEAYMKPPNVSV